MTEIEGLIKKELWSAPCALSSRIEASGKALLAVSGGMDSMCLADLFLRIYGPSGFAIAHCNFNLRSEESDGDQAMVSDWAHKNQVELHTRSFDTEAFAAEQSVSIEMAARELRYRWFAELCLYHGYAYVAVAHHADDNAETMVLNLVRGTGLKGVSGMKSISQLPYSSESEGLRLVRPLLEFTRKQIEGYVHGHKVPYREDSTNASVEYRRNSVRHEVFPVFGRMNPSYVRTLNKEMRYFAEAEEIVSQWCASAAEAVVSYDAPDNLVIDTRKLKEHAQWRYLLYHILDPLGFTAPVLESIEDLLSSERTVSGKRFDSVEYVAITGRDHIRVSPASAFQAEDDGQLLIHEPGLYRMGDENFIVELCPWSDQMPLRQPQGVLAFDAQLLNFPFVCRRWKRGDWMFPFGMKGRKKLSDIFADLKWHDHQKRSAILIAEQGAGSHVAGLLGVRMDGNYKISKDTTRVIRIRKQ